MPVDISQFFEGFFDEVAEHLEHIEELVVAAERTTPTREDFDALFRAAHSIKGASGTFGFGEMAELTHVLESVLGRVRDGSLAISKAFVDAVLATTTVLRAMLSDYRATRIPDPLRSEAVRAALQALVDADAPAVSPAPVAHRSESRAFHILFHTTRDAHRAEAALTALTATLRELGECAVEIGEGGTLSCTFTGKQTQAELEDVFAYVSIEGDSLTIDALPAPIAVDDGFGFFDDLLAPAIVEEQGTKLDADSTVRVKLHKIDALINLVGEMLIAQSTVFEYAQRLDPVEHADLHASIDQLQRHARDIRDSVMSVRMLPIGTVFSRFPRMLRDLSAQLGKDVTFQTSGDDTELDKGLIESISDPLTHIIRNALDHGIESPSARVAAGKPAQGTISVRSFQRGGNVVIEVRDDGAGMNRDRILSKAQAVGIALRENMTDRDVWALACMPGFSTAETVTDVSGRGVGMDVVKRNILALGGALEIDSVPGEGTTIALVVPLTLAIQDGLAVRTGDDVYIVPLGSIVESIPLQAEEVVAPPDVVPFIMYRGAALPLISPPGESAAAVRPDQQIAVVVEADGRQAGLLVDQLESEHQVVIKSLERNFRRVNGFSGATVLGNGHVALILDIPALLAS